MDIFSPHCRAVVGLGNPGPEYRQTRHNLGFMVVRALTRRYPVVKRRRLPGIMTVWTLHMNQFVLYAMCPLTYMNRSGLAVHELCTRYHLEPGALLVVLDDLDLPLGRLRLRRSGGSGGHRGLQDILTVMRTQHIPRLRLGIGVDPPPDRPADFLLSPFDEQEWPVVYAMIDRAVDTISLVLHEGYEKTMARINPT